MSDRRNCVGNDPYRIEYVVLYSVHWMVVWLTLRLSNRFGTPTTKHGLGIARKRPSPLRRLAPLPTAMSNEPKRIKEQVKKAEEVLRSLEQAIAQARKLIDESKRLVDESKAAHKPKADGKGDGST